MGKAWTIATFVNELEGRGSAPALIAVTGDETTGLSSIDLAARARNLAGGLVALGIEPGEPVGLLAPNGIDWVVARLGLALTGALVVALDDQGSEDELRSWISEARCRRLLAAPKHIATLRGIHPGLDLTVIGGASIEGAARRWTDLGPAGKLLPELHADDPAMLVYTSGTTGAAKSFVLTHANLHANVRALSDAALVDAGDRVLLPLPLHHVYPFVVGILTALTSRATVVFPESATGPEIMRAIRLCEVSTIIGVPRLYEAMMTGLRARLGQRGPLARALFNTLLALSIAARRRLGIDLGRRLFHPVRAQISPRLRLLVSGGARLSPEVLWPLIGLGFEVRSGYGLAETASVFTGNLPGAERLESEGKPFQGALRIADPDEQGIGEILLKGPSVFAGYRNNPKATAEAFTPDGWFRTTDLGRLDRDGFLFVAGRKTEVIVLGGAKKVDPEALEKIYGASPHIRELAVLERRGALAALVVPELAHDPGRTGQVSEAIRVALATAASTLPSHQRIAGYALSREPLPRTRLGKVQRFRLPALYEQALAGTSRATPAKPSAADEELLRRAPARRLYDLLTARYPQAAVSLDAHPLLDLGIDSLEWVSLGLTIKEQLGIELTEADLANASTVRELLASAVQASTRDRPVEEGDSTPALIDWIAPLRSAEAALGVLIYTWNRFLMRLFFRVRAEGAANLPEGACVIVANHASDLDPALLAAVIDYQRLRHIYWSADAKRVFGRRWRFPFLRAMQVFPVEEGAPSRALALAGKVLARSDTLVWFPEGWRSPDGRLQRFFPGIGELLTRTPVPVVPVWIAGSFEAMPRQRRFPRPWPVRIRFGSAIPPDAFRQDQTAQQIADRIRSAVAALEIETTQH